MSNSNSSNYEVILTDFKALSSILKKNIRAAKNIILSYSLIVPKNDIRNTWKIINEILSKNKASKILILFFKENSIDITNKTDIANKFNDYFTSISQTIAQGI